MQNINILMEDTTRRGGLWGQALGVQKQKNGSFFLGNGNQKEDRILDKQQEMQKRAMKVVLDTNKSEGKLDADLQERRNNIKALQNSSQLANEEINRLSELTKQSKEEHGVADDSPEQKKLDELLKLRRGDAWTEKEWAKLGDLGELTEYQRTALENDFLMGDQRALKTNNQIKVGMETSMISGINKERLKVLGMVKAEKTKDTMMEAASQEVIDMFGQEAKEHIQEEQEKVVKDAEEKSQKAEEQGKKLEEARLERKEAELEIEQNQSSQQGSAQEMMGPLNQQNNQMLKEVQKADSSGEKIEAELRKIIQEEKLLEEELKGLVVDTAG